MKDRERGVKCRKVKYRKKHKIRELESQTDRHTDRQTDRHTDRQTERNGNTECENREREGEREDYSSHSLFNLCDCLI